MTVTAASEDPVAAPPSLATRARRRALMEGLVLSGVLALFFGVLVYANCVWFCFPGDNDLDEVAWITAHLSFSRAESFANQGYPPGLPVVLRLLTPLVGSFLTATYLWQAIAATASVFFVYRIATELSERRASGPCALLCAVLGGLPVFTSQFADGSSTALFLGGFWLLARRVFVMGRGATDQRGFFLFGLAAGLAYLFRTHYLILMGLVPVSLVLAGLGWRNTGKVTLAFLAGFAATAWPLWLANTLAYGEPLHAGVSQYNIAYSVLQGHGFDWEDYPNTYNLWPLSRIVREQPGALLANAWSQIVGTLSFPLSLAGAGVGSFAMVLAPDRVRRQLLTFGGLIALAYVGLVIVPTRYTARAYAPVAMLCSILVGCGAGELIARTRRPWLSGLLVAFGLLLTNYPGELYGDLVRRAKAAVYNAHLIKVLVGHGMRSGSEVFSNDWSIYNLADPQFITFYNYGGWIELDSLYAKERPHPTAYTVPEWKAFFQQHGIRFAILKKRARVAAIFAAPPQEWQQLYSDKRLTVWAIPSEPTGDVSAPQ